MNESVAHIYILTVIYNNSIDNLLLFSKQRTIISLLYNDSAVNVLKDLIKERKDLLEPVFYAEKRFELSFYRNQVNNTKNYHLSL